MPPPIPLTPDAYRLAAEAAPCSVYAAARWLQGQDIRKPQLQQRLITGAQTLGLVREYASDDTRAVAMRSALRSACSSLDATMALLEAMEAEHWVCGGLYANLLLARDLLQEALDL
jgi:hypothetical protein